MPLRDKFTWEIFYIYGANVMLVGSDKIHTRDSLIGTEIIGPIGTPLRWQQQVAIEVIE